MRLGVRRSCACSHSLDAEFQRSRACLLFIGRQVPQHDELARQASAPNRKRERPLTWRGDTLLAERDATLGAESSRAPLPSNAELHDTIPRTAARSCNRTRPPRDAGGGNGVTTLAACPLLRGTELAPCGWAFGEAARAFHSLDAEYPNTKNSRAKPARRT